MTTPFDPVPPFSAVDTAWSGADHDPTQTFALAPQVVTAWRIVTIATACLFGLPIAGLGILLNDLSWWVRFSCIAFAIAALVAAVVWPVIRYRAWRYRLGEFALELERGVVVRRTTSVPYHRVQHVDVNVGLVDRVLGLATLRLHTAAAGTDASLPALATETAEGVRLFVLQRTDRDPGV